MSGLVIVILRFDPDDGGAEGLGGEETDPLPGRDGETVGLEPGRDGEIPMPPLGGAGAGSGVCAVSGAAGSGNIGETCICANVNGTVVVVSLIGEFPDRQRDGA